MPEIAGRRRYPRRPGVARLTRMPTLKVRAEFHLKIVVETTRMSVSYLPSRPAARARMSSFNRRGS